MVKKKKSNGKGSTPVEPKSGPPKRAGKGAGKVAGAAAGAPGAGPGKELEQHRAKSPTPAPIQETVPQMTSRLCKAIRERDHIEGQKKAAAFDFHKKLEDLDKVISDLGRKIEEADTEEIIDHVSGIVTYKSKTTGAILRQRPLAFADKQEKLPLGDKPAAPPKGTFGAIKLQTIWEHDQFGPCRILAITMGEVRVQTAELLDNEPEELTIGKADWDAANAYPRELPKPQIGSRWRIAELGVCTVRTTDDLAAVVEVEGESAPKRISRLKFVGAVLAPAALKGSGKALNAPEA